LSTFTELCLEDIPFPALSVDLVGNITDVNQGACNLTGYNAADLVDQKIELLVSDGLKLQHINYRQHLPDNRIAMAECRQIFIRGKQAKEIPASIRIARLDEQFLIYLYESSKNISSQSNLLLENAHKILRGIEEPYWQWDIEQDVMHYSAQLMALLGYNEQAITAPISLWEKHLEAKLLANMHVKVNDHIKGESQSLNMTFELTTNQGIKKWVNVVGKVLEYKDNRSYRMYGSVRDITESKQLLNKLKKQNDYLNLAEEISNSGHWRYDVVEDIMYWSTEVFRIYGVEPANFEPSIETVFNFHHQNIRESVKEEFFSAINNVHSYYNKNTIFQHSGSKRKIETIGEIEVNCDGKATGMFGICRDITKSEDVFEKLKLLAMVNYTIKVPIFFIDDNDNVVYQDISPQHGDENSVLFNYINFSITEYMSLKKKAKVNGQVKLNNASFDKYNSVFDLSVTYEAEEGIYIWIVENVTEKYRQDQQQIISNRLALLGNTFGNVSHDINNVLGVALGAIEMLELKFSQGDQDITPYIERVKNAIDKGKSVTERLLAFTRKPTVKVIQFDPIKDIEDNQYLFKQLLLSTINLSFDFDNINCLINFPQGEFINILLNIVLNAQDAVQEKGLSGSINISALINDEGRLEIHIKDSGVGISQENISKIFDPFYSSKSVNKGNGIGLANVYNTMYKHNGQIQVEGHCDLGGAEFILIFKCKVTKTRQIPKKDLPSGLNISDKSILILDDEVSIAEFVSLYLSSEGADTTHVTSKEQLLSILEEEKTFDIFITDMILPDLTGQEAVNFVLEKFPHIKIFSISGYIAIEDRKWDYPVLRKPFNSKELAKFLTD